MIVMELLRDTALYVLGTLLHNLPALALGVLVAAAMQVYVDPDRMRNWLLRRSSVSIPATVAFGAFTPFCACGTMAVVLSMAAVSLPWGPIMAFLTSSPLMSPEEFILLSGVIGPSFAAALAAASVLVGLGSGYAAHIVESRTGFLRGQLRFNSARLSPSAGGCGSAETVLASARCCSDGQDAFGKGDAVGNAVCQTGGCGCGVLAMEPPAPVSGLRSVMAKLKLGELLGAAFDVGVKRILPLFALFAAAGYLINRFIPSEWITALFGQNNWYSVPLASVLGLPLYVNGDSSVPLIRSLMASGVGPGAMLSFMITGPGTSAGVIAGIATILKKRALLFYVGCLLGGAVVLGYAYDLVMAFMG